MSGSRRGRVGDEEIGRGFVILACRLLDGMWTVVVDEIELRSSLCHCV